jgi:hypothetical protein
LSRGLMNKFLHAPMQALKQAARDEDAARIEAIRATFALEPDAMTETLLAQLEADVVEQDAVEKVRS